MPVYQSDNFGRINENIDHQVVFIDGLNIDQRLGLLVKLIQQLKKDNFIIFTNRENQNLVFNTLISKSVNTYKICRLQNDSENLENLHLFKGCLQGVLVATDILQRGFHIDKPCTVINFDISNNITEMIHRFGRTGRLGQKGQVVSMITKNDESLLRLIQESIENKLPLNQLKNDPN